MKFLKTLSLIAVLSLIPLTNGCLTSKSTNGTTSVNQTNLGIVELTVQSATTAGVVLAYQNDKSSLPIIQNVSVALTGIISGANTNSVSQILKAAGQTNAALGQAIVPLVTIISGLEQSLIASAVNSTNSATAAKAQIAQGLASAVNSGITLGLASIKQ